ncbi:MAG: lipoyl synthase [Omnitrophica bacterium GWA2_52_8]|nr:MAG: lipoyl synthase [Omnitrophica bacterium GWA2_52_8]
MPSPEVLQKPVKRLPDWLRRPLPAGTSEGTRQILSRNRLTTVCEEAKCPNRVECYSRSTATFMILGDTCTRSCGFCSVKTGKPLVLEADEPARVAQAVRELGLGYVVITSVARDDLKDEGAGHFAGTIRSVRAVNPGVMIEVLTPDFHGREELISAVVAEKPDVFNHNLETVERLQRRVRVQAEYRRSLGVLAAVKRLDPAMVTKSGLMLGLGESQSEIMQAARDLKEAGCDILTLGQYLNPESTGYLPVERFVSPQEFEDLERQIQQFGFKEVFAGPYVRSSYHAGETFLKYNNAVKGD